ncbi:MAG: phosphoglycerate mutase [Pseudoxanthomonas sp.]|nr:phosphoglycerate mutase [Pseudoxanthomonas sp.]
MASATLLLPARTRFAGEPLPAALALALARADSSSGEAGVAAQLRRHFQLLPDHWPVAALTRQRDAADAENSTWLRVEPAHVAPDRGGARMLSYGDALGLDAEDTVQLLPALKPVFGDAGFTLDAPRPARWYLRLPREAKLPVFAAPEDVLGDDLFAHLPEAELGRRWRALLNEAQVILHNHPWNEQRVAAGKLSVNSLWFWGAGVLPDAVRSRYRQVKSKDALVQALAGAAGVVEGAADGQEVDALVDLRHLRSLNTLDQEAVQPLLQALERRELEMLGLDFEDGAGFNVRRGQRWRFWRRPLASLSA